MSYGAEKIANRVTSNTVQVEPCRQNGKLLRTTTDIVGLPNYAMLVEFTDF